MVGPLGQPVGKMGLVRKTKIAMIEMAQASGIQLVPLLSVMPATAQHLEHTSLSWMP